MLPAGYSRTVSSVKSNKKVIQSIQSKSSKKRKQGRSFLSLLFEFVWISVGHFAPQVNAKVISYLNNTSNSNNCQYYLRRMGLSFPFDIIY